jgi:hypothetical protein
MEPGPEKRHSKLGIMACFMAVGVWIYFVVTAYLFFNVDGFTRRLSDIFIPQSSGMTEMGGIGVAVLLMAVIFFVIPGVGHLVGVLLALIGILSPTRKRLFPVLGLFVNLLPILILLVLLVIGGLTTTS